MNENERIESVFGGKQAADNANTAGDKDARIAELERELQREKVEAGRLKKTNEELAALREENARLKERHGVDDAIESVPEDVRNEVAPEVLKASGAMMSHVSEKVSRDVERQNEEIRMLREENARRDRNLFAQRINMQYPGFMASVSDGGDKREAWNRYQRFNANTIVSALESNDFETISYHIERFCNEIGVPVPSGASGSATPDPRASGGYSTEGVAPSGKTYTVDEFNALFEKKEEARDRGDYAEVKRLSDEINRAPAEGRVTQ